MEMQGLIGYQLFMMYPKSDVNYDDDVDLANSAFYFPRGTE